MRSAMTATVIRFAMTARCRVCCQWSARDWWIEDWPVVHIVRSCWRCRANETQFAGMA